MGLALRSVAKALSRVQPVLDAFPLRALTIVYTGRTQIGLILGQCEAKPEPPFDQDGVH